MIAAAVSSQDDSMPKIMIGWRIFVNFTSYSHNFKGIKKLANILFRFVAVLIFFLVALFLLVQVTSVQGYVAKKTADFLSEKLNTRIDIGSVEIQFFKTVVLNDVYIEDLHRDTLLYSKRLKVGIEDLNIKKQRIYISDIILLNAKTKLTRYKAEEDLNFQFIIDAFANSDTAKTTTPWDIRFNEVSLVNTSFAYRDEHDTTATKGINYFDLRADNINGRVSGIIFEQDTIHATIDYFAAIEKSGFILQNLSSYVNVSPVGIKLDELKIKTPESTVATDLSFSYKKYGDFRDFIDSVKFKADFNRSVLELSDIAYFAPALKGIYKSLIISGKVNGKVTDLKGKDMDILMGDNTRFMGDVTLTGLPNIDETLIYLNIKSLTTNHADLKQIPIPPFEKHENLEVPVNIAKLGIMKFKGTFTGLYKDFYAYGNLSTALGSLSSDLAVRHDDKKNKEIYKGKIKSTAFDVGKFFGARYVGKVTANVDIDGSGLTLEDVTAGLKGTINSLEFNNYFYKNVAIEGNIAKQIFKGKLNVKDDNIDFDFIGKVDLTQKLPRLDFITTLNKADLAALHFIKTTDKTNLSTQMIVNVTGNNIDNLSGQVNFDNTIYIQNNEVYKMSVFNLLFEEENNTKSIKLFSDFLDAKVAGNFKVLGLPVSVEKLLSNYLPAYFSKKQPKNIPPQNFEYSFLFKKTDAVTRLFAPGITIAPKTLIEGKFNSTAEELSITGNSSKLNIYGYIMNDWSISALTTKGQLDLNMNVKRLNLTDSLWMNDFKITTNSRTDSVNLAMAWDNKSAKVNKGDIKAFMHLRSSKSFEFKILPSEFTVTDSTWSISSTNDVIVDSTYITVKDLRFEHGIQSVVLNGIIADNKKDQMKLGFNNFNLSNLNAFTKTFGLKLSGSIDGESVITDMYNGVVFTSNNNFKSFSINDNALGDGAVASVWDKGKEALYLHGSFTLGLVPNILFSGYYYPKKKEESIDMEVNVQALQMQLFEPFIKEYCSDFKGFFAGNITVKGSLEKPKISGLVNINAKKVTVAYLNTTYKFSHDIVIENNSFGVENMDLYDVNNNKAQVTGKVYHDNFKNYQLDFDIQTYKFMCLNTTEINNNLYYGKAFVSGTINIFGFTNDILIDASVKTEKVTSGDKSDKISVLSKTELTKLFIPLGGNSEVSQNNFITFVNKDSALNFKNDYKVQLGGLRLNFDLDITPDAEVQLIFDQKVGDVIKARGNGNIALKISSLGDFKMYGDYVIQSGDYLFTLQNVINKRFDIEKGGTIKWSGVPYKADINLSAIYKSRASLKPFFPADSTGIYKKRSPVDLKLLMTGDLLSPEINFDIGLPTVDGPTRQTVLSYINSDAETNRQVFSILILNSFVTPYQLSNSGVGPGVGDAAAANSTELLSNQLSNMLSKISNDFDVGVNYRPGDAISKDELEVALSTQLFNDKLTIDGNFGVNNNNTASSNNQSANNIVGDVNIEYKLTDDGKLRVKTFNKSNDNSQIYSPGPYTQGVGIFYREEFDTVGELFRRYLDVISGKKRKNKKSTEPKQTISTEDEPSQIPPPTVPVTVTPEK
ncbi:MAG: translocation/assembly module TamB domain-containing protein [Bacteroidota bacterium]